MDPPLPGIKDTFFEDFMRNIGIEVLNLEIKNKLWAYISKLNLEPEQIETMLDLVSILIGEVATISLRQVVKILEEIKNY